MDYFAISCFFYIFASMTIKEYIAELTDSWPQAWHASTATAQP